LSRRGRNVPASVKQRLLNRARAEGRQFMSLLTTYANECFLRRLQASPHAGRLVLKGGLLLLVWRCPAPRPTIDVDFLAHIPNDPDVAAGVIREVCQAEVEDDGMRFDLADLRVESILEDADYAGLRLRFGASLGRARVRMQVDLAFGDVVVPMVQTGTLPAILPDYPSPRIRVYTPETTISEKFEAMVKLGILNSRMKDFYDIWLLAGCRSFDGGVLAKAIRATFDRRETEIPRDLSELVHSLASDPEKHSQWAAFVRKADVAGAPADFASVLALIELFLGPVVAACASGRPFALRWFPPRPWDRT